MKKTMIAVSLALLAVAGFSRPGIAGVDINIGIAIPPPVAFSAPPELVVIPGTYVYVAPDVPEDVFFYHGYWWRPWRGHWYRSHSYREGWSVYKNPPRAVVGVPRGWRADYKNHRWNGQEWRYTRVPHHELEKNWNSWERAKRWDQPQYRQLRRLENRDMRPQNHGRSATSERPDFQRSPDTRHGQQERTPEKHKKDRDRDRNE
jgi:hypothetical protein